MSRRGLYSIAPHAPFLATLADRILDGTLLKGWPREGAFWLSDITIILPTRRARLALAEIFANRLGGAALLPDIRTFGGEVADEEPFLPPADGPTPLPRASQNERRLTLSKLVAAFANSPEGRQDFASPPNAAEIYWLADSLGTLIDDLAIEGVSAEDVRKLDPMDLAENWQRVLRFLDVALTTWPVTLAERGKVDAAMQRNQRLMRQAQTAPVLYGERPVIAAGSTGSIPATATLLGAIAGLPRGAVVLPGLDTHLSPQQHDALLADGANTHGHPQYGLALLLKRLSAGIADVEELAPSEGPRTLVLRAALAPADETPHWIGMRASIGAPQLGNALRNVSVIAARNADLEARAIALRAREAIAGGKSVGIVTPDQNLARRIAAELRRFAIEVDDPAGTPMHASPIGRLARLALAAAENRFAAVDLMALLRHRAVSLGLERASLLRVAETIERRLLRGQFPSPGLDGLRRALASKAEKLDAGAIAAIGDVIDRLAAAMEPLIKVTAAERMRAGDFADALQTTIAALGPDVASVEGHAEFTAWATELAALDAPPLPPVNSDGVLAALMKGVSVRAGERRRDDIFIWGALEARLMNPDVIILAGLNENVWPAVADPGPWLSRQMRIGIGLSPPEKQQGQAAHDFEMAMGNAEVVLAYAQRMGTSPALPSRLVQRLMAFIGENNATALRNAGDVWLARAEGLDFAGRPAPAQRPAPNPDPKSRPRKLSITEIEPLIRSPYDIYAKHVLGLRKIEPLGAQPGARERGTMIHRVFETFVEKGHDFGVPDAAELLAALAEEQFAGLDMIEERRAIWLKRFRRAAALFLDFEREREGRIAARVAEKKADWVMPTGFTLTGKADRIDIGRDGALEIIDFKTGGVPASKDMKAYEAPQLLLEAAMARAGAFAPEVPPADSALLTYIKIGLGPAAFQLMPFRVRDGLTLMQAVDEIELRLNRHVEAFLLTPLPMPAHIRPKEEGGRKRYPGDYDQLARRDEWIRTEGVDDP